MHIIKKLVVASHNAGKVREFQHLLLPFGVKIYSAGELNLPEPEETGETFAENARLKAEAAAHATGMPALSDDSGLVVPALDGAPGIYSARWAGPDKNFSQAMARVQSELLALSIPEPQWKAHFTCSLALCFPPIAAVSKGEKSPDCECHIYEGHVHGQLVFPPRGEQGFGYDPIFIPEGHTHTFGELDPDIKHSLSHRARALELLFNAWFSEVQEA